MAKKTAPGKKSATQPAKTAAEDVIYRLKITLSHISPPIWRRVEVPGSMTLADLHSVIQDVMGWEECHLHQFCIDDDYYSCMADQFDDGDMREEADYQLKDLLKPRKKFTYEYDFGDGWLHQIIVEAANPPQAGVKYPLCLDGERACPPEDCGGPFGYKSLLEVQNNPRHPDYRDLMEWLGGRFHAEAFDVKKVNRLLAKNLR